MQDSAFPAPSLPLIFFTRAFAVLAGGLFLACVIIVALGMGFQVIYSGYIFPGVSVAGIDLSGLSREQAALHLRQSLTYPHQGRIVFQDGGTVWVAHPAELGLVLDADATAQAAYSVGRSGILDVNPFVQFQSWYYGVDLPPLMIYDERIAHTYLKNLAESIDRPTLEASLGVNGVDVIVRSGQVGRFLNIDATLRVIEPQLQLLADGLIPLVVDETPPVILDATRQAEVAKSILSAPLILTAAGNSGNGKERWVIEPDTLVGMLAIERATNLEGEDEFQVRVSSDYLTAFLENLAPELKVAPENARFIFNDDTRKLDLLKPSVTGRQLLVAESVESINQKLAAGEHKVDLVFDYTLPAVTSEATAADLGITELVSSETSYFYSSSNSRIQNIAVASSRFHGLLVAPGETFSMGEVLGDVSLDTGFSEALIIFGDRTIKGVGGGVCQVSTTLFRTVFFGGYQVDERYPHAYRVYYYELTANGSQNAKLAGLDATVYVPLVDFKFTNDSKDWLLMETYVSEGGRSLTWKFYSTSDGRTVDWSTSGLRDREEPPDPLYQENPELAKGEIKQVDWAVDGANVEVNRTVTRKGDIIHEDTFTTNYRPWRAVYEYGPGTKIPKEKDNNS